MPKETITTTCDQQVYPNDRYGSFHGHKCGRPVKEDGKCGIHCASAVAKRNKKFKKEIEERMADRDAAEITRAVFLLKKNKYSVIHPNGEKL